MNYQAHPYHLVTPSPWPLFTSFSLFSMAIFAVSYFHGFNYGGTGLALSFVATLTVMILWFKDVVIEGTYLGDHTLQVQKGIFMGMILFIISEVFAFLSIFWAYFHSSLSPTVEIGNSWPPQGIVALDPWAIPLLNTVILLSSGITITYAHHALIQGNRKDAINGTFATIILALIFTGLQYVEYSQAMFTFADSVYGSVFFASTGLHGLHIIIGTIFLTVGFVRIVFYHLTVHHHAGYEAGILYWHFVDVVWLFLFIVVYWWGG